MAALLQFAGHFENLFKELLNATPLIQAYKKKTKDTLNHGRHCTKNEVFH